jgi:hypothetical protein
MRVRDVYLYNVVSENAQLKMATIVKEELIYKITSISGTTLSGKKCLSGIIFHAI